jgi:hypothetical protein
MTNKEVMQMALDVLANNRYAPPIKEVIEALRAALAQPEPEPVALEREACAKMVEPLDESLADAIRARGQK